MKTELNNLLHKEMDRTAFLQHVGIGLVALTGLASVMKALTSMGGHQKVTTNGFGSGSYGGGSARKLTD